MKQSALKPFQPSLVFADKAGAKDKHYLLRKSVNYGRNEVNDTGPTTS